MTPADYAFLALALWREARGQKDPGMAAVGCVVRNRVLKNKSTYYAEITKKWAFSSITATGDAQLGLYANVLDNQWHDAQSLAQQIADGKLEDVTGGATLYWNPNGITSDKTFALNDGTAVKFPETWNPAVVSETVRIGAHIFLKEL